MDQTRHCLYFLKLKVKYLTATEIKYGTLMIYSISKATMKE